MASATVAPQVYGGDEVAAIVLDPGSSSTRIGYAGEDTPRIVLPSYYGEYEDSSSNSEDTHGDQMDVDEDKKVSITTKKIFDENLLRAARPGNYNIKPILKDSLIEDWDGAIEQWGYSFDKLSVNFDEQPLLMTEPVWNTKKNKVGSMEAAFEIYKFPAFYSIKNPTSISFAHGRPNCLVVDIGHDMTTITPVIDGLCLIKSTMKTHYAGAFISQQLRQLLLKRDITIEPTYKIKSKTKSFEKPVWKPKNFDFEITESFESYQRDRVIDEMKETLFKVTKQQSSQSATETKENGEAATVAERKEDDDNDENARYFELPNGLNIKFNKERNQIPNSLFKPNEVDEIVKGYESPENGEFEFKEEHNIKNDYKPIRRVRKDIDESTREDEILVKKSKKNEKSPDYRGLSDLITNVLSLIDVDLKAQVANNIILTGATSLIPGLTERLQNELVLMNPSLKIRIHATGNTYERKYSSFIGSSILASLGTFHQLWVSKQEYEEVGVDRLLLSRFK